MVLCAANSYTSKYFLNPNFEVLPEETKNELKVAVVTFTEEAGGILVLDFDEKGDLKIKTFFADNDIFYDEVEYKTQVKNLQDKKKDLLVRLEKYYKVQFLHMDLAKLEEEYAKDLDN